MNNKFTIATLISLAVCTVIALVVGMNSPGFNWESSGEEKPGSPASRPVRHIQVVQKTYPQISFTNIVKEKWSDRLVAVKIEDEGIAEEIRLAPVTDKLDYEVAIEGDYDKTIIVKYGQPKPLPPSKYLQIRVPRDAAVDQGVVRVRIVNLATIPH